jgi:hypothetical protein
MWDNISVLRKGGLYKFRIIWRDDSAAKSSGSNCIDALLDLAAVSVMMKAPRNVRDHQQAG